MNFRDYRVESVPYYQYDKPFSTKPLCGCCKAPVRIRKAYEEPEIRCPRARTHRGVKALPKAKFEEFADTNIVEFKCRCLKEADCEFCGRHACHCKCNEG